MPILSEGRIVLGSLAAFTFWLFVGLPLLKARDQMDFGTVPQWLTFIAQGLTFAGVVVGFCFTARQLRHYQRVRETENVISISDSTVAHNTRFPGQREALNAVQMIEGLNIPASGSDTYWATREVHLSHINLVWRVWELAGRPGRGETINPRQDGWERFAREIITKKLRGAAQAVNDGGTAAADLAGSDLWSGLQRYEAYLSKFVRWLDGLDRPG
jgi:hypothetical protein